MSNLSSAARHIALMSVSACRSAGGSRLDPSLNGSRRFAQVSAVAGRDPQAFVTATKIAAGASAVIIVAGASGRRVDDKAARYGASAQMTELISYSEFQMSRFCTEVPQVATHLLRLLERRE